MIMLLRNRQPHKSDATILETPQMISVVNRAQFSFCDSVTPILYQQPEYSLFNSLVNLIIV